jgi:hypothetical protein
VHIRPVAIYPDPFRGGDHILVMCECLHTNGNTPTWNTRGPCAEVMEKAKEHEPWFGLEQVCMFGEIHLGYIWDISGRVTRTRTRTRTRQHTQHALTKGPPLTSTSLQLQLQLQLRLRLRQEYTLFEPDRTTPLHWPAKGCPRPQGPYYCGSGVNSALGRMVAEAHLRCCLFAGLTISGINAEVSAAVRQCGSAAVRQCGSAAVRQRDLMATPPPLKRARRGGGTTPRHQ